MALAAAAPAAAASGATTFALALGQNPLVIPAPAPVSTTTLSVQNIGASTASGPVDVVISGMAPDGFTVGAVPGSGWSNTGGTSDDELSFTWNGTLDPGGSNAFFLVIQYHGSSPRPVSGSLLITPTDPGIDAVLLQIQMPADAT